MEGTGGIRSPTLERCQATMWRTNSVNIIWATSVRPELASARQIDQAPGATGLARSE